MRWSAFYRDGMDRAAERLRTARQAAGFKTGADAARRHGWPVPTYLAHENGTRGIKRAAQRYAAAFNVDANWLLTGRTSGATMPSGLFTATVPVRGVAKAGAWLEMEYQPEHEEDIAIPAYPGHPIAHQFAVKVEGNSIEKVVKSGHYVVCIGIEHYDGPLNGKIVYVRRTSAGKTETTLKRYRLVEGQPMLFSESDDPQWQKAIRLDAPEDDARVEVVAVALSASKPL